MGGAVEQGDEADAAFGGMVDAAHKRRETSWPVLEDKLGSGRGVRRLVPPVIVTGHANRREITSADRSREKVTNEAAE